jgi:hypothetical protein
MNGKSGRQQIEAARTLPIAAKLTATVLAPRDAPDWFALLNMLVYVAAPTRFHQRAIVDRFEAFFHPEMCAQLMSRHSESMRHLETRLPWQQLDFPPATRSGRARDPFLDH